MLRLRGPFSLREDLANIGAFAFLHVFAGNVPRKIGVR